jgi:hypothetical protein
MRWIHTARFRLRSLFRRRQVEEEIDEELRDHLRRQTDELVALGMDPQTLDLQRCARWAVSTGRRNPAATRWVCGLSTSCGRMSATRCASCDARRRSPRSPSPRWRWGSVVAPRSSRSSIRSCCGHYASPSRSDSP